MTGNLTPPVQIIPSQKMGQSYDFSRPFAQSITALKLFGFWRPDIDMKYKITYHCYTAVCMCLSLTFLLSQIIYINTNKNSVQDVSAALYITITFVSILLRALNIYKDMNYLKIIITEKLNGPLFQVKCEKHYEIAEATNQMYRKLFHFCLFLGAMTDFFGVLFPMFAKEKTILAKAWFPYDWTEPLNYVLTYVFQNVALIWHTFICYAVDIFMFILFVQIGVQCDMLCYTLDHLDDFQVEDGVLKEISLKNKLELRKDMEKFSEAMSKNLVMCIRHHKEIVRLSKDIQRINGIGIFILFTSGALILCTCLFQLSMVQIGSVECVMLLFFLMSMLTEQFLYCWFGNEIIYKSSAILQSTFNTPWVDCNNKFRKILLQLMTQTYRPITIVAGGLLKMSVPVFISVVRTSYSYFTLLQGIQ